MDMEYSWIDNDREKRKYSEKSWLNNALFTTDSWIDNDGEKRKYSEKILA